MSSTASLKASGATAGHILTICMRRSMAVLPERVHAEAVNACDLLSGNGEHACVSRDIRLEIEWVGVVYGDKCWFFRESASGGFVREIDVHDSRVSSTELSHDYILLHATTQTASMRVSRTL
jgi:hypothetical protein